MKLTINKVGKLVAQPGDFEIFDKNIYIFVLSGFSLVYLL